ncbi:MAG: hypothetical protein NXI17_09100 [Alphaproteobacteria bacterium]|nr:hypothetical protein [Alphaproteobacteria bacterium]
MKYAILFVFTFLVTNPAFSIDNDVRIFYIPLDAETFTRISIHNIEYYSPKMDGVTPSDNRYDISDRDYRRILNLTKNGDVAAFDGDVVRIKIYSDIFGAIYIDQNGVSLHEDGSMLALSKEGKTELISIIEQTTGLVFND